MQPFKPAWLPLAQCPLYAAIYMLTGLPLTQRLPCHAAIYMLTGIPLAFIFWYKRLYNAAASDRALSYLAFFMLFGVHTGFCIWAAIGEA